MSDTFIFTKEKLQALLVRLFTDGCKGRQDLYQKITDCPDALASTLQSFLKSSKSAKSQIPIKRSQLLAILKDAFHEGKASYPETRESVVQRLMDSLPKPKKIASTEQYEKEFQRLLFDKWATMEYTTTIDNVAPIYYYDSAASGQTSMSTNMNQWIINF